MSILHLPRVLVDNKLVPIYDLLYLMQFFHVLKYLSHLDLIQLMDILLHWLFGNLSTMYILISSILLMSILDLILFQLVIVTNGDQVFALFF